MKYGFIAFLMMACVSRVMADDPPKEDPIDKAMDAAMQRDPSTAGMVAAISDASDKWDTRLNSDDKALKARMDPDEWKLLVAAQKAWVTYRDLQKKSVDLTYSKMEGSMWVPVSASKVMELTKDRALYLDSLLQNISER